MNDSSKRIAALIHQGKKLEAIKVLRETTGVGLKEAKEEIERLMAADVSPNPSTAMEQPMSNVQGEQLPEDVVALVRAGRKIEAIKLLRDHRGIGLKEAKQLVDGVSSGHQSGCLSVLMVLMLMAVVLFGG